MVCSKHKDLPKATIKKYREARRAKKLAASGKAPAHRSPRTARKPRRGRPSSSKRTTKRPERAAARSRSSTSGRTNRQAKPSAVTAAQPSTASLQAAA
jgi:hypothetical protein